PEMGTPGIRAWEHLRVPLPMRSPGGQGHVREQLGQGHGKFHLDVRETYDLHVPYRKCTFWHESPPSWKACILSPIGSASGRRFDYREEAAVDGRDLLQVNPAPLNRVANSCSVRSLPPKV